MRTHQCARNLALLVVVAIGVVGCAPDDNDPAVSGNGGVPGAGDGGGGAVEATIVAESTAFDVTSLDVPVNQELTITYDNRDDGIQHNLHVRDTATGDAMTDIVGGPVTQTLTVRFDQSGEFAYFCDVHPQQMLGAITVSG